MQSDGYGAYDDVVDAYDSYVNTTGGEIGHLIGEDDRGLLVQHVGGNPPSNFDDPKIASLPRILLMGPRRGGKTSIQVSLSVCFI